MPTKPESRGDRSHNERFSPTLRWRLFGLLATVAQVRQGTLGNCFCADYSHGHAELAFPYVDAIPEAGLHWQPGLPRSLNGCHVSDYENARGPGNDY
jgi:hypothetical protein